jgi:hypothetical protein
MIWPAMKTPPLLRLEGFSADGRFVIDVMQELKMPTYPITASGIF